MSGSEAYLLTKWHLDLSSHLATTDMGRKLWDCAALGRGSWIPISLAQCIWKYNTINYDMFAQEAESL